MNASLFVKVFHQRRHRSYSDSNNFSFLESFSSKMRSWTKRQEACWNVSVSSDYWFYSTTGCTRNRSDQAHSRSKKVDR